MELNQSATRDVLFQLLLFPDGSLAGSKCNIDKQFIMMYLDTIQIGDLQTPLYCGLHKRMRHLK